MSVLDRAELLIQKGYSGSGDWLDESGNGHDAAFFGPLFKAWDGTQYIHLPGTAGNFISTPDVNLLDADTAHGIQSVGKWVHNTGDFPVVVVDIDSPFGETAIEQTPTAAGVFLKTPVGIANNVPMSEGETVTLVNTVFIDQAGPITGTRIFSEFRNAADGYISTVIGSLVTLVIGEYVTCFTTATAPATTAYVRVMVATTGGTPDGTQAMRLGSSIIREGSDATFVPSLRIVGDVDDTYKATAAWATAGWQIIGSNNSFRAQTRPTGKLYAGFYVGGTSYAVNTAGSPGADGDTLTIRITRVASTGSIQFFVDGSAFESAKAGTSGPLDTFGDMGVGAASSGADPFTGEIHYFQRRDGIDGPIVARADFTEPTEPFASWIDAVDGRTWTINRSATGRKSTIVDTDMMLRGTDDYHEVPDAAGLDFAAAESFTLMSVVRAYDVTPGSDMILSAKKVDLTTSIGWAFYIDTTGVPTLVIDDGTNPLAEATGPALTDGVSHAVTAVRNVSTDKITVYTDGVAGTPVTDSTVLTLVNAEVLRFGRLSGAGTNYIDGETVAEVLWREALSDVDIVAAEGELLHDRSGAGSIAETHTVVGSGSKDATDIGAISHGHTVVSEGVKAGLGISDISHGHTVVAVGFKNVSGVGTIAHGHTIIGLGAGAAVFVLVGSPSTQVLMSGATSVKALITSTHATE